jgi:RNA polymerase sigma factor (TIGR02999 family)
MEARSDITPLLVRLADGDGTVLSKLTPVVYQELRRLAGHYMRRERTDHTLQTTALVHEAYLRLTEQRRANWRNRAHFFGVAAQLMRRILVDHARNRGRMKRGGENEKVSIEEAVVISPENQEEILLVDEALRKLEKLDARQSRIVELKFFGGLSTEEAAEALGTSPRTVEREWALARAWLYMQLQGSRGAASDRSV